MSSHTPLPGTHSTESAPQILGEDTLKKTCEDYQLCIIAVLPHILDTGMKPLCFSAGSSGTPRQSTFLFLPSFQPVKDTGTGVLGGSKSVDCPGVPEDWAY